MTYPIVWMTGLSGAGKSTLCRALEAEMTGRGVPVIVLDGDEMRRGLCRGLGFSRADRIESLCRISWLAGRLAAEGNLVLVAAISPYRSVRRQIRDSHSCFLEVFVNAPLAICEERDPKGLYRRARGGEIPEFTGISAPYEAPEAPDVECRTDLEAVEASCRKILREIERMVNRGVDRDWQWATAAAR